MKKLKAILAGVLIAFAAIGETPLRIVDTVAELDALYPNIEQPAVLVRGLTLSGQWSPPKMFFWEPSNTSATNDYIRDTRMGVGRWAHNTSIRIEGLVTIGETNLLNVLRIKGGSFGTSMIILERAGVGTNGIFTAGGSVSIRNESSGRSISTFTEDSASGNLYLGGNGYSGYTTGRTGRIYAPGVDLTVTNENLPGGNLYISPGTGTGTNGTTSSIQFIGVNPTGRGSTLEQVRTPVMEVKMPQVLNEFTHNTAIVLHSYTNFAGTNEFFARFRMVLTNFGGNPYMSPIFVPDP